MKQEPPRIFVGTLGIATGRSLARYLEGLAGAVPHPWIERFGSNLTSCVAAISNLPRFSRSERAYSSASVFFQSASLTHLLRA